MTLPRQVSESVGEQIVVTAHWNFHRKGNSPYVKHHWISHVTRDFPVPPVKLVRLDPRIESVDSVRCHI